MRSHWHYKTDPRYLVYLSSKDWPAKREQVIGRCNNTCERCGKFAVSEVHHLTYARIFHEDLEDLQGLCEFCHAYLHGERADDGTAEYEERARRRQELERWLQPARAELARFEGRPDVYRRFAPDSFASPRDLMAILRQHPRIMMSKYECEIANVRYAKRIHDSAVSFHIRWKSDSGGRCWMRVRSAEELLYPGKLVLDTERGVWVQIDHIRSVVRYHSLDSHG